MATSSQSGSLETQSSARTSESHRRNDGVLATRSKRSSGEREQWASADEDQPNQRLDQSLGWFSIGLGLAEVLAPRTLGRLIGVGEHPTALRLVGMREIASGIGLLSGRAPAAFAVSRVAGDAMDLALLSASLRSSDSNPARVAMAATAVTGVAALDLHASRMGTRAAVAGASQDIPVKVSLAINSSPQTLYDFWRNLENLPRFMRHLESVRGTGERTSHWVANGPGGIKVEWDSEIVDDQPGSFIAWRTLPDSAVNHHGSVRFEPGLAGRGTVVRIDMHYGAPGGNVVARAAKLVGEAPADRVLEDLRRLKQLIETGEIATTNGQPSGSRSLVGRAFRRRYS